MTMADRAQEALTAVAFLRSRSDIAKAHIGFWGISQAGWVMPIAAVTDPSIAFVISVSGAGAWIDQGLYYVKQSLVALRLDDSRNESLLAEVRRVFEKLEDLSHDDFCKWFDGVAPQFRDYPVVFQAFQICKHDPRRFRFCQLNNRADSRPWLAQAKCPVLAVFGSADGNVDPVDSARIYREELTRAGNRDFEIRTFPQADHGICVGLDFAPGYLDLMTSWLTKRFGE
jgi:pimeloyl-ACP methyl ester carboxylesterase